AGRTAGDRIGWGAAARVGGRRGGDPRRAASRSGGRVAAAPAGGDGRRCGVRARGRWFAGIRSSVRIGATVATPATWRRGRGVQRALTQHAGPTRRGPEIDIREAVDSLRVRARTVYWSNFASAPVVFASFAR